MGSAESNVHTRACRGVITSLDHGERPGDGSCALWGLQPWVEGVPVSDAVHSRRSRWRRNRIQEMGKVVELAWSEARGVGSRAGEYTVGRMAEYSDRAGAIAKTRGARMSRSCEAIMPAVLNRFHWLALLIGNASATASAQALKSHDVADSLMVGRQVPNIRGRAVCDVDSLASSVSKYLISKCDFGGGLSITLHRDTVYSIKRSRSMQVLNGSEPLLDVWNREFRDVWETTLGRRPDNLNSEVAENITRFEVVWDQPGGVRHMITLARPRLQPHTLEFAYLAIDCRESDRRKQAIACW